MDRSLFVRVALAFSFVALALAMTFPTFVQAQEESSYDNIVKELKSSLKEPLPQKKVDDDSMKINAGAALVGSYVTANAGSAMLSGFDLHLGIELFSPEWLAETSVRSFSQGRIERGSTLSLDEYDLKLVHQSRLQKNLNLRIGGGMAAQYLKTNVGGNTSSDQTPSLLALVGVDKAFSPKVSLGPDVSYRMPLVSDSSEKGSFDASLRLNFYF